MQTNKLTFLTNVWRWIESLDSSTGHYYQVLSSNTQQVLVALKNRVQQLEESQRRFLNDTSR